MTAADVVIVLLGVVAVGSGVLVVGTRQLVHAALWLVLSFAALAGAYILLAAEFVAWVQVLIYVGAVVVLLLFGIMLTRAPIGRSPDLDSGNRIVALVVAGATAAILVTTLARGFHAAYVPLGRRVGGGSTRTLGASLFQTWVLPFEALSVLLLAALVGAIVLSRTDIRAPRPGDEEAEEHAGPQRPRGPGAPRGPVTGRIAAMRRRPTGPDDEDTIVLSRVDEEI